VLMNLFGDDMIPVIAPLGAGRNGETYNINGDTVAGAIAAALKADRLLLLTDVAGVKNAEGEVVTALSAAEVEEMTASGTMIAGGMIPKTETALHAVRNGVRACTIVDGRVPERGSAGAVHRTRRGLDDPCLTTLRSRLRGHRRPCGRVSRLEIFGAFHPSEADGAPEKTLRRSSCSVRRNPASGPMSPSDEFRDGRPDPIDRWSRRVIGHMACDLGARALFPFGGPPWHPFIAWALRPGRAWESPVGFLVHDQGGASWSPIRGALALNQTGSTCRTTQMPPCAECPAPCLTACPVGALSRNGYDAAAATAISTPIPGPIAFNSRLRRTQGLPTEPELWSIARAIGLSHASLPPLIPIRERHHDPHPDPDPPCEIRLGRSRAGRSRPPAQRSW
jgi:hypothetical protein